MPSSIVTSYRGLDGGCYLAVIAKREYQYRHASRAAPSGRPAVIYMAPEYAEPVDQNGGRLVHDTELIAGIKPATDVLVLGKAYSHRGPVPALSAAIRAGAAAKAVQVWGDRRLRLEARGQIGFSAPEPFTAMPLTWERAYGGRDVHAESKEPPANDGGLRSALEGAEPGGALSYPRNPYGRGFFLDVDRERLSGALVPNIEDAGDPVRPERMLVADYLDWIDCPVAACFEPIDLFTFPRALFFLPADFNKPARPIHEVTTGVLGPPDLARMDEADGTIHPRSFNCAPAGLATHRLYGGERVQLWNLHRERELFEFDLPGDRPRLIVEPPGVGARDVEPLLQTVLVEPDADRVTLTWAGAIPVASVYPDEMTAAMRHAIVWTQ